MGTTCMHCLPKRERAEIERLCTMTGESENQYPLAISKVGSNYYAAVRREGVSANDYTSDDKGGYVFAAVFKTSRHRGEFCYKAMDEASGPYFYDAPAKILNLLSPTTNENALKWREGCRSAIASKKALKALKDGDRIELASPVYFAASGDEPQTRFTVTSYMRRGKARRGFYNAKVGLCRLGPNLLSGFKMLETA